jgi:hypothetical protein
MQFGRKLGYGYSKDSNASLSQRKSIAHKAPCYVEWIQTEAERRLEQ